MKKFLIISLFIAGLLLPQLSGADFQDCKTNAGTSDELCNPLIVGTETNEGFSVFLFYVIETMGALLGGFSVVYVVFAGFRMIIAQGNSEALETAKSGLQWALLGLVLVLISYVIIVATQHFIGIKDVVEETGTLQNPLTSGTFGQLIGKMLEGMLKLSGTLALLMILVSGFRYLSAGANEEQAEQAKTSLQWSAIGLMVILLAYVIVVATVSLLPEVTP